MKPDPRELLIALVAKFNDSGDEPGRHRCAKCHEYMLTGGGK